MCTRPASPPSCTQDIHIHTQAHHHTQYMRARTNTCSPRYLSRHTTLAHTCSQAQTCVPHTCAQAPHVYIHCSQRHSIHQPHAHLLNPLTASEFQVGRNPCPHTQDLGAGPESHRRRRPAGPAQSAPGAQGCQQSPGQGRRSPRFTLSPTRHPLAPPHEAC